MKILFIIFISFVIVTGVINGIRFFPKNNPLRKFVEKFLNLD